MRGNFLRGVVLGSVTSALVLGASAALAGTGVGGVFNLGKTNTVNAASSLTGSTVGSQLTVANSAARGLTVTGAGSGAALLVHNGTGPAAAFQSPTSAAPFSVNSSVQVASLNASLLGGHGWTFFLPLYQSRAAAPVGNATKTVESDNVATSSITIGADGLPIMSYFDWPSTHLKVVHCTTVSCSGTDTPQTADSASNVGAGSAIAIGTDGLPIISYYDFGNHHLKVVHCTTRTCSSTDIPQTADSSSNVGSNTSIAIGADGLPIISYYDLGNGHLKVVHCTTTSCSGRDAPQTVDSSTTAGDETSIAIGADGLPIISYFEYVNFHTKVVHCTTLTCSSSDPPYSSPAHGQEPSLAIGADGLPIVSFWGGGGELDVVHCTTASCSSASSPQTLDSSNQSVGQLSSLTIGADGLPIISYSDPTDHTLRIVHCTTVSCTTAATPETVENIPTNNGYYSSITIGADGLPIVSYTDTNLKVMHCANVFCVPYLRRR